MLNFLNQPFSNVKETKSFYRKIVFCLYALSIIVFCCLPGFNPTQINAAKTASETLSSFFISASELKSIANSNSGAGPLSTGSPTKDQELTLAFGTYSSPQKFKYYNQGEAQGETFATNFVTPHSVNGHILWQVAGLENNDLVVYSKYPLIGDNIYSILPDLDAERADGFNSYFHVEKTIESKDSSETNFNYYPDSNLADMLNEILLPEKNFFSTSELNQMKNSTIETLDTKSGQIYSTTAKLYPAYSLYAEQAEPSALESINEIATRDNAPEESKFISLGTSEKIEINSLYWHAYTWLRSPASKITNGYTGTAAIPQLLHTGHRNVVNSTADAPENNDISISAAVKLNASNINFLSAAHISNSNTAIPLSKQVSIDTSDNSNFKISETPLYLKLKDLNNSIFQNESIGIKNGLAEVLHIPENGINIVAVITSKDGETSFSLSKHLTATDNTVDFSSFSGLDNGENYIGKVWLEVPLESDNNTLCYASTPRDISFTAGQNSTSSQVTHFYCENGTTETRVTGTEKIVFSDETLEAQDSWIAIDNSKNSIPAESIVTISWMKNPNANECKKYYNNLPNNIQKIADQGNLWFFDIKILNSDGVTPTEISGSIPIMINLGNDWNVSNKNIKILYAEKNNDTPIIAKDYVINTEDGQKRKVLRAELQHFSTYALYYEEEQEISNTENSTTISEENSKPKASSNKVIENKNVFPKTYDFLPPISFFVTTILALTCLYIINRIEKFSK